MSVSGTYDVTIDTPLGKKNGRLTVEASGAGFYGSITNDLLGSMDIAGDSVNGNTLGWTMAVTSPMPMTLDCQATVVGDAISGTVKAGMFGTMELSGTRVG